MDTSTTGRHRWLGEGGGGGGGDRKKERKKAVNHITYLSNGNIKSTMQLEMASSLPANFSQYSR